MTRYATFWPLQVAGWLAFGVVWYMASLPLYDEMEVGPGVALVRVAIYVIMGLLLTLSFRPLYHRLWHQQAPMLLSTVAAIACSIVGTFVWAFAFEYVKWPLDGEPFEAKPLLQYMRSFVLTTFLLLAWSLLYFGIKSHQQLQLETERALRAESLAHKARIEMLRYQLNPHFLFNALNSIRALVSEDGSKAREMVTGLSDYLRFALLENEAEVTIREEIDVIQQYLAIEKIRFEERLEVTYAIDEDVLALRIPALLIHPLVENALKHGVTHNDELLRLRLEVIRDELDVCLRVANMGQLRQYMNGSPQGAGIGLRNVQDRLGQVYPERHAFQMHEVDGWVIAEITLRGVVQQLPAMQS